MSSISSTRTSKSIDFKLYISNSSSCTMHMQNVHSQKKETKTARLEAGRHTIGRLQFVIRQIQKGVATGNAHETTRGGRAKLTIQQLARLPLPRKKARYGPASAPIVSDQVTAQQRLNNKTASEKRCPSWLVPAASHISSYDLSIPTM